MIYIFRPPPRHIIYAAAQSIYMLMFSSLHLPLTTNYRHTNAKRCLRDDICFLRCRCCFAIRFLFAFAFVYDMILLMRARRFLWYGDIIMPRRRRAICFSLPPGHFQTFTTPPPPPRYAADICYIFSPCRAILFLKIYIWYIIIIYKDAFSRWYKDDIFLMIDDIIIMICWRAICALQDMIWYFRRHIMMLFHAAAATPMRDMIFAAFPPSRRHIMSALMPILFSCWYAILLWYAWWWGGMIERYFCEKDDDAAYITYDIFNF